MPEVISLTGAIKGGPHRQLKQKSSALLERLWRTSSPYDKEMRAFVFLMGFPFIRPLARKSVNTLWMQILVYPVMEFTANRLLC